MKRSFTSETTRLPADPPTRLFYSRMDTLSRIEQALDGLRPYIASHKGSIEVIDYDDSEGALTLRMGGTCHGCSGAASGSSRTGARRGSPSRSSGR